MEEAVEKPASVEKVGNMDEELEPTIGEVEKIIYFTCYSAGSSMGNLAWRISFGLVNILYMVEYNNYSLHHIGGLDLSQVMQPTDVLITDTCHHIDDEHMKKTHLYDLVKDAIVKFYEKNGLLVNKMHPKDVKLGIKPDMKAGHKGESKLLLCCEPGELVMEVMAVGKRVLEELQAAECR